MRKGIVSILSLMMIINMLGANSSAQPNTESVNSDGASNYYVLGLIGYNYTDRIISEYTVNGGSGGYIALSSKTGGGSGVGCCVRLSKKKPKIFNIRVRWQFNGCVYLTKDERSGLSDKRRHYYYKEAEVVVRNVAEDEPAYLETHFYPDGSIKAIITSEISYAVLQLDERRPDKSEFPRCENDEKPVDK